MKYLTNLASSDVVTRLIRCGRPLLLPSKLAGYCLHAVATTPAVFSFKHRDLEVIKVRRERMQQKPEPGSELLFGHQFSDHMLEIEWTAKKGWSRPLICPVHDLVMHPAAKVFHYAVELFEGMKAYRCDDDKINLFRPEKKHGAHTFDKNELKKLICELVTIDASWVPKSPGSLYIRPTIIATEPTLGLSHAEQALLFVLTGPVGQYYSTGFKPVSLYADPSFCRSFLGGVGQYKMGCNYAPTILVSKIAASKNCQQVLWLYGEEQWITEVGAMNIFIYWKNEQGDDELVTAPLYDGIILPGVTRDSVLHLGRQMNDIKVTERYVQIGEIRRAIKEERMYEMFGTGTACVVSPVDRILYKNPCTGDFEEMNIPTITHKPNLMQKLHQTVVDIQYGKIKMPEWTMEVTSFSQSTMSTS
ncbi:branched-chain-amino-acid aminotransferase [Wuchereria bancrofti]|uniref:Branched-chain-amino-acid aminotransferase n=1 Tax=Wuchereria bancrofti TaxID=6293 RepID=J9EHC2_WUCBA|nr:branched-chain-amino-acid aminotransferase [Wuchereria bancrofti]